MFVDKYIINIIFITNENFIWNVKKSQNLCGVKTCVH